MLSLFSDRPATIIQKTQNTMYKERLTSIPFNVRNQHPRDLRIQFYPEPHVYKVDEVEYRSVTKIIGQYFEPFDTTYWANQKARQLGIPAQEIADQWAKKGLIASQKGTALHSQIEHYLLEGTTQDSVEFSYFLNFVNDHATLKPYRTEWTIFHEAYKVAGTLDLIAKREGKLEIYDWKRSKNLISTQTGSLITHAFGGKKGYGVLNHIPDTAYHKYCLQQSIYRFILEEKYGLEVNAAYLIVLHPRLQRYYKLKATYYPSEAKAILMQNNL